MVMAMGTLCSTNGITCHDHIQNEEIVRSIWRCAYFGQIGGDASDTDENSLTKIGLNNKVDGKQPNDHLYQAYDRRKLKKKMLPWCSLFSIIVIVMQLNLTKKVDSITSHEKEFSLLDLC